MTSVRDAYEKVVGEHGFRVVSTTRSRRTARRRRSASSFSDDLPVERPDLADFVTVEGGDGLAIEPQQQQICINGVVHGGRYTIRLRAGLPAADGETLAHPVEISVYVRDRDPWVGFAGNAYVLPAGPGASIPLTSVNTDTAKATIYRIPDRGVAELVRDGSFLSQLSTLFRRRHRQLERREGLGGRDRHQVGAEPDRDDGDPDRRRAAGDEARRLRHHRGAGDRQQRRLGADRDAVVRRSPTSG